MTTQTIFDTPEEWTPPVDGPDMDIEDPFAGMDEALASAPDVAMPSYTELPDGRYQVFIYSASQFHVNRPGSKRHGYVGFYLRLRVLNGPHRGETHPYRRYFHKNDAVSMGWLRKDLAALGMLEKIQQEHISVRDLLGEQIGLFVDRCIEIQVKRSANPNDPSNPYVNTYINRVLDGVTIPEDLKTMPAGATGGNGGAAGSAGAWNPGGGIMW